MVVAPYEPRHAPPGTYRRGGRNINDTERLISFLGGGVLAGFGLRRRDPLGIGLAALGGALMLRGATGHSTAYQALRLAPEPAERQIAAEYGWRHAAAIAHSVTIGRPRAQIYRFWRDFGNLPRFMSHVERIDVLSDTRSHWVVRAPMGRTVEWDAEIEDERENARIAWRSGERADIRNTGAVMFRDAPGGRGTEVHVEISYEPPAGQIGRGLARLLGEEPSVQLRHDLRRLKQLLETGEIATVAGQPAGRRHLGHLGR